MGAMFLDLINRLTQPRPEPFHDGDARLALAALLVRIARSDGDYAAAEIGRIDRILAARFGLTPDQAFELRRDAEEVERQAPDTVRFTRAVKEAVPYGEREAVIEALWEVVLADGMREQEEDALLRLVADLLGVNDRNSNILRKKVEARLG